MIGSVRTIWEAQDYTGQEPTTSIDTDDLDPPTFVDIVATTEKRLTIGPSAVDTEVTIPNCCAFLLVSDQAVGVQINGVGTLAHTVRHMAFAATDETGIAIPACSLYLTGNGTILANVRILYWETV